MTGSRYTTSAGIVNRVSPNTTETVNDDPASGIVALSTKQPVGLRLVMRQACDPAAPFQAPSNGPGWRSN